MVVCGWEAYGSGFSGVVLWVQPALLFSFTRSALPIHGRGQTHRPRHGGALWPLAWHPHPRTHITTLAATANAPAAAAGHDDEHALTPDVGRCSLRHAAALARATAVSAPRMSAQDLGRAREVNAQMEALLEDLDPQRFTELNHEFHAALTCRCDNPRLTSLVEAEWARLAQLRSSTFAFVPDRASESVREHGQILGLIEAQASPEEIERACRAHRLATVNSYLRSQSAG